MNMKIEKHIMFRFGLDIFNFRDNIFPATKIINCNL